MYLVTIETDIGLGGILEKQIGGGILEKQIVGGSADQKTMVFLSNVEADVLYFLESRFGSCL